jgi:hypothetical protein
MDYSDDHARLRIPWPEARSVWDGPPVFSGPIEIFGRQWRIERWDQDAEQTWLHLVFVRAMPISKITPVAENGLRRSRPASVDIAWAALENALFASIRDKSPNAIERLRQPDLIPVGRAVLALIECIASHGLRKRELIETRLRSVAYLEAELAPSYGRVPWRILPERVRAKLLRGASGQDRARLLDEAFEGFPAMSSPSSPRHAA